MSADDNAPEQAREVEAVRREVAYLLWQIDQGYISAEDRAVVAGGNWMALDYSQRLHPDDEHQLPAWLQAADALLAALAPVRAAERQEAAREAWDDGYFHGWDDESFEERGKTPNPHRADGVTGRSGM